jgi:dual-specificity kinase
MECIAEMPRAPLDRRPRKRQRLGWDVGPAEMHQVYISDPDRRFGYLFPL